MPMLATSPPDSAGSQREHGVYVCSSATQEHSTWIGEDDARAATTQQTPLSAEENEMAEFVAVVLADTEQT